MIERRPEWRCVGEGNQCGPHSFLWRDETHDRCGWVDKSKLHKIDAKLYYLGEWTPSISIRPMRSRREQAKIVLESFLEGPRFGPAPEVVEIVVDGEKFTPEDLRNSPSDS